MDDEKTTETNEDQVQPEAEDATTGTDTGSSGSYRPPGTGERGDPKRDPESGVPREPVKPEPGDISAVDHPGQGKDTRGG